MISANEVITLKNYTFESFPELEGMFAIRSFDPPKLLESDEKERQSANGFIALINLCNEWEDRVSEDLLSQTTDRHRAQLQNILNQILRPSGFISIAAKISFLEKSFAHFPSAVPVNFFFDGEETPSGFTYITQYPSTFQTGDILTHWNAVAFFNKAPTNFKQVFSYFLAAHEIGHAIQKNRDASKITQPNECLCDTFAFAATLHQFGNEALPTLRLIIDMRMKNADDDQVHATADILQHIMHVDSDFQIGVSGRRAIEIGQDAISKLGMT